MTEREKKIERIVQARLENMTDKQLKGYFIDTQSDALSIISEDELDKLLKDEDVPKTFN